MPSSPALGRFLVGLTLVVVPPAANLHAWQDPPADLARERADYANWLRTASNSPFAAIIVQPIGTGLSLGPADADIPLTGVPAARLVEANRVPMLERGGRRTPLARNRALPLRDHRLLVGGIPGRSVVVVFGEARNPKAPDYYPFDRNAVYTVSLEPPARPMVQRLLGSDGLEVEATFAGTVRVTVNGTSATLRVMRIPVAGGEESDLEIYFRDATNGHGSYPAGRFVRLYPLGAGRYRLDFNRARNSFCAYSTVYPCPAPWRGNTLTEAITAGERYAGGGLDVPVP